MDPPLSEARYAAALTRERGTEAAQVTRILRERGVDAWRIHLEDESMDTIGNAVFTAARYLNGMRPRPRRSSPTSSQRSSAPDAPQFPSARAPVNR